MEWKYSGMGIRSLAVGVASLPCGKDALAAESATSRILAFDCSWS